MQYAQPSPGTGNDEAVGTAVSSTDTGDHTVGEITYMRSGIVAVGTPGGKGWKAVREEAVLLRPQRNTVYAVHLLACERIRSWDDA